MHENTIDNLADKAITLSYKLHYAKAVAFTIIFGIAFGILTENATEKPGLLWLGVLIAVAVRIYFIYRAYKKEMASLEASRKDPHRGPQRELRLQFGDTDDEYSDGIDRYKRHRRIR